MTTRNLTPRQIGTRNWLGVLALVSPLLFVVCFGPYEQDRAASGTSCLSNEKQLGLALLMYTQDSDGRFPDGIRSAHKGVGWSNFLLPYVKAHNVFRCNLDGFAEAEHGTRSQQPISYGYNSNLAGCSAKDANFAAATVTIFETTGSSADLSSHQYPLAAGDELAPSGNGLDGQLFCTVLNSCAAKYATGLFGRASLQQTQFAVSGPRHNGGSNFVFADGHVKCIKAGMLSAGANAKSQFDVQTGGVTGHAAGTGKGSRGTFSLI